MCVCEYIYIYIYTHTHIHTYTHTNMVRESRCLSKHVHTRKHLHTHTYIHTYIYFTKHTHVNAYIHVHTYRYIHTYTGSCLGQCTLLEGRRGSQRRWHTLGPQSSRPQGMLVVVYVLPSVMHHLAMSQAMFVCVCVCVCVPGVRMLGPPALSVSHTFTMPKVFVCIADTHMRRGTVTASTL
jgi:hypothetical protein